MTIDEGTAPIDLGRLQAEINDEVRRRRAAGDFPPGLERELDAVFARYAPAGAGDDFAEVLAQAEIQSFVHADVPVAARIPVVAYLKRALRKAMAFYIRFLAQQVTSFAGAITRAVKLLGQRVDELETISAAGAQRSLAEVRERCGAPDLGEWAELVVGELGAGRGRVLHTECGAGALLGALSAAGADAYGIEPVETLAVEAARAGLDVRADDALTHLRAVPDAALGGVILSGCVDALPIGAVLELADRVGAVVAPGARVVVLSAGGGAWRRGLDPVVADLAPGRPLHPDTWAHLLGERGFVAIRHVPAPPARSPLRAVPQADPRADTLDAQIRALNDAVFGPPAYAVIATKS